jgi:hypothetical protein
MSTDSSREASIGSVREKRSKQRKKNIKMYASGYVWMNLTWSTTQMGTSHLPPHQKVHQMNTSEKKDRFKSKRRAKKRKQEESQSTSTSGSTSQEGREKKKRGKRRRKQADESRTDEEKNGQSFYTPASPMYDSSEAAAEHAPQFNPEPEVVNISSEDNVTIH